MTTKVKSVISGVDHIHYFVENMKRSVAFYRDILGLEFVEENEYWSEMNVHGVSVGLHWTEGGAVERSKHAPVLTFRVNNIKQAVSRLQERGVKFRGDIDEQPWGSTIYFTDPDGNIIKLRQPPQ